MASSNPALLERLRALSREGRESPAPTESTGPRAKWGLAQAQTHLMAPSQNFSTHPGLFHAVPI